MGTELFERQGAILLARSDGCSVWQFRSGTGDGTMTVYDVFPGTMLCVNDFHMERYESCFVPDRPLLAIDHCREGRKEFSPGDDMLAYTEAGDMELDLRIRHTGTFIFPSHHYHGLTVVFDRDIVERSLPEEIRDFPATAAGVVCWCLWALAASIRQATVKTPEPLDTRAFAGFPHFSGSPENPPLTTWLTTDSLDFQFHNRV